MFISSKSYNLDHAFKNALQSPKITNLFGKQKIANASDQSLKGTVLSLVAASESFDKLGQEKEAKLLSKIAAGLIDDKPLTDEDWDYMKKVENEVLAERAKNPSFYKPYDPIEDEFGSSEDIMDKNEHPFEDSKPTKLF